MRCCINARFLFFSVLLAVGCLAATLTSAAGAEPRTITVDPAGNAEYTTIAAAVAVAQPGDIIQCAPGQYALGANLNIPVTLKGAQAGVDARDGRPGAQESVITGGGLGMFYLNAAGITIDGFKFSNLKGRTLETYYNADDFTMRNCILQGSSIDPGYSTGAIQFGGGQNLHANGLLFERNLVTADHGQLFYLGHAMDNGIIRNNKFNGDSVSFGPFGNRTGWVIEGNEFNGDVPGHGKYYGSGFNANLGDATIQNNLVTNMYVGLGQISLVGGKILNNTFDDNAYAAFQLWGGEWGSVVSGNVDIENNIFNYNGTACTSYSDAAHAIRLRPNGDPELGIDASSIHIQYNQFADLLVGTCGEAWAIRNNGKAQTAADAVLNWWGQATGPASGQTNGLVNSCPWIYSYQLDPANAAKRGFWPDKASLQQSNSLATAVSPSGSGTLLCNGAACATSYACGQQVTIATTPVSGYAFASWAGCDSITDSNCVVTTGTVPKGVTAYFDYSVTFAAGPHGTLTGTLTQVVSSGGSTTPVSALPDKYYDFLNWTDAAGNVVSTSNPIVLTGVTSTLSIKANFVPERVNVDFVAGSGGKVAGDKSQRINYGGSTHPVSAKPDKGYSFVGWSGPGGFVSTENPLVIDQVNTDQTITAIFSR